MRASTGIGYDHRVVEMARSLGLPTRGDCLVHLREHAIARVDRIVDEWPEPVGSLGELLTVVAARLSVCIEYVHADSDLSGIARRRSAYALHLDRILNAEFILGTSEGLLIPHQDPQPGDRRFLVIVDARGSRASRAFFTAWHEISHVLTTPPQLELKLYRRSPAAEEVRKDPVESAVDHVAGVIAFYPPVFSPVLDRAVGIEAGVNFRAVERARADVAPDASTYAVALAAVRLRDEPLCFVHAEPRLKPSEIKRLRSPQEHLPLYSDPVAIPKLRLLGVVMNEHAKRAGLRLHENLRVPASSVMARIERDGLVGEHSAQENQNVWATSGRGPLPPLSFRMSATRRGPSIYGLVAPG